MSGIAGIIRFDGQAVAEIDRLNIVSLLKHRGEVSTQVVDRGVLMAFGGTLQESPSAPTYAAVDADVFENPTAEPPFTTNYAQTGPASFNELNADFAIALWDSHRQSLICARDILGVKPLYYVHQPGRFFAFASEIKSLLVLQEVSVRPNEHKFREYLTWITAYMPYSAETFYETIYSVLPGHYLQVDAQGLQVTPYWRIDFAQFDTLSSSEDYSTLFQAYFTEAIDRRIAGKKSVGSHLSGGLDSSSVSAVAQSLLVNNQRPSLHTFNIDTGLASTDESEYVRALVDKWHPQHHKVSPVADVLESILRINSIFDRPDQFIIPSSFHLSVSLEARQIGCDILLTGHDGDSVIATGFDWLDTLLETSDWVRLEQACRQYIDLRRPAGVIPYRAGSDPQLEKFVLSLLGSSLKKRLGEQSLTHFLGGLHQQKQIFDLSLPAIVTYCIGRVRQKLASRAQFDNAFSEEFKQRVTQRPQLSTQPLATSLTEGRAVQANQILNTTNVICNEQLNHIGAYYGHPYSFPFFDKNVVELGLATPLSICFDKGRGRGLIRHGLDTLLPPAILSRYTKANFVEYGTLSAQQLYTATHEQFSSSGHPIWGVINPAIFAKIVALVFNPKMPVNRKTRYNWLLSRIIYLALWLGSLPKQP